MKRLFCVKSNKLHLRDANEDVLYFDNKQDAKKVRDDMNLRSSLVWLVSRGPDHIGKHGHYGPSKMRRQPKKTMA